MKILKVYNHYCFALFLFLLLTKPNYGQEHFNATVGFGFTEMANIGIHYQVDQTQYGISVGVIPWSEETYLSLLGDVNFHFGGYSELSDRKPWYFKLGLNYLQIKNTDLSFYKSEEVFFFIWRLGREFNISKKIGIYFDLGTNVKITYNNVLNSTEETCCNGMRGIFEEFDILPSFGLGIFYNF